MKTNRLLAKSVFINGSLYARVSSTYTIAIFNELCNNNTRNIKRFEIQEDIDYNTLVILVLNLRLIEKL